MYLPLEQQVMQMEHQYEVKHYQHNLFPIIKILDVNIIKNLDIQVILGL
jgi:hypothetical protein